MFKKQRGVIPYLTFIIATIVLVFAALVSLNFAIPDIIDHAMRRPFSAVDLVFEALINLVTALFLLSPLWFVGGFLASLFPELRLVDEGVKCRSIVFTGIIKWSEIDHMIRLPNAYVALTIHRRGVSFMNGLYFNRVQGMIIRHERPVLLIAPGLDDHDALLGEIRSRSRAAASSHPGDLYT
jgi:hypothetical protein